MAQLTLWGMYQYNPNLFEEMVLPEGYSKTDLRAVIMRKSGMLYPWHQVPPRLKTDIGVWFRTRYYDFQQMYAAFTAEYNPIENYNRYEDRTLNHGESGADTLTDTLGSKHTTQRGTRQDTTYGRKDSLEHGLTQTRTPNTTTDTTNTVAAFDVSGYSPRDHQTMTNTGSETVKDSGTDNNQTSGTDTISNSGSDIVSNSGSDTHKTDYGRKYTDTDEAHIHGNIGVTTNQQMIESEIEMRMKYDLYDIIAGMFEEEFLVQVY